MAMRDGIDPNPDDWFTQNAPPPTTMPTGPVTSDSDPRLSNPAYGSDPDVLNYINNGRGVNTVNGPTPTPQSTPTATYTPSGPQAPATYNYEQALAKVQQATGHTLSQGQIDALFKQFGGDRNSTFNDAGLAPVIAQLQGAQYANPDNTPDATSHTVMGDGPGGVDGFGNPIDRYSSNPNAPQAPNDPSRMSPYVQPVWNSTAPTATKLAQYHMPTQAELEASPGYQARLAARGQAFQRGAAAKGSILSGGTIVAADRDAQNFASNEYANLVGQGQTTTQLNNAATQGDNNNAFDTYRQTYGEFGDAANLALGARQQNVGENNTAFNQGQVNYGNRYTQYLDSNNRTLQDYLTNQATRRNSETDYWTRLMDLNNTGANAANNSYKFQAFM